MTDAQDRRSDPRISTEGLNIQVTDTSDGSTLGVLANLSQNGLMLISEHPLMEGASYQVRLCWQLEGAEQCVNLGIHALWSSNGPAASAWTGFQIIDIDPQDRQHLIGLLLALVASQD